MAKIDDWMRGVGIVAAASGIHLYMFLIVLKHGIYMCKSHEKKKVYLRNTHHEFYFQAIETLESLNMPNPDTKMFPTR